jgi:hypothetical protein
MQPTRYTQAGTSYYKRISYLDREIPPCQHHYIAGGVPCSKPGEFDAPTPRGPWADLCRTHVETDALPNSKMGFHRFAEESVKSTNG